MDIIQIMYKNKNDENALPMAKYMKNLFPFLGIKKPERSVLTKDFYKNAKKNNIIDWDLVFNLYSLPEREFHYIAIGYLDKLNKLLTPEDMDKVERLITTNSWWDSVDSIAPLVGYICVNYPEVKQKKVDKWIFSQNIWLKRVSILFQLKYKENTDVEFLAKAILNNNDTNEFFINKAIGWALREYSKTNKIWVKEFIENNNLSKLSIREGSKYI